MELRVSLPVAIHRRLKMYGLSIGKTNSEIVISTLDARLPEYPMEAESHAA